MEWIRRMGLKKALFTMTFINLILATQLSVLSFWICLELSTKVSSHMVEVRINDDNLVVTETEKKVSPPCGNGREYSFRLADCPAGGLFCDGYDDYGLFVLPFEAERAVGASCPGSFPHYGE